MNYISELININEYLARLVGSDTFHLQQEWEQEE